MEAFVGTSCAEADREKDSRVVNVSTLTKERAADAFPASNSYSSDRALGKLGRTKACCGNGGVDEKCWDESETG
eukprot:CAMPEP_0170748696 /NCGR_PEP_ID=MMETSP0437-20130122/10002_1 /TAXON_ID=0 /ORGANISM="Sexangularia sp." /LENGTH=73 /DNA_ID=CAMNT_0011087575 /DNA_START=437 /DNA_END=655 /DNA_ORIENTATION=+